MKKFFSFLAWILVILLCTSFTSCDNGTEEESTVAAESTAPETAQEKIDVVIASGGEDIYTLIRFIDATRDEVDLILDFKNTLNAKLKLSFGISTDWKMPSMAPENDAPEIVIGLTDREATSEVISRLGMGYGDCAVQICDNNKIVIVAPNYEDLAIGFEYFINNLSVVNNSESGEEQVVYTGGNYFYEVSNSHLWDDISSVSEYQIVYGEDGKYKKQAEDIAKAFKKNYDISVDVVCETKPKSEREIIVGMLSDTSRFAYDYSELNGLEYIIATSDKSILICGSNETSIINGVEEFISRFLRSGNIITMNLPVDSVLSFSSFTGGENPSLAEDADTRIMSFNILSEEWDPNAVMSGRDVRVSAAILNYSPDVAALQEVSNAWYPVLENYIGDVYDFTRKKTPSGSGTYTTLIYNTETTRLIEEGIKIYAVGNSQRLRSIVWGVFESVETKEQYIVFSTHWDAGSEKTSQRTAQAKEMAEFVKELYNKYKLDIFACGDYNASESSTEYKTFMDNSGFVDAKKSSKVVNRACKTYHTLFQDVSTSTYDSIDHITFMPQTASKVLYYNTLICDYVLDASDHCPIYIDVKLAN